MFWEVGKRAEVSGTLKFHVKDSKSCIVNYCYCSFTGTFKGLRANFLPSSYFSMNHLVRVGKILLKRRVEGGGWSQAKKWNKQAFKMLVIKRTISFPNGIGVKSRRCVVPGCSPAPFAVKNILLVMLVNTSAND